MMFKVQLNIVLAMFGLTLWQFLVELLKWTSWFAMVCCSENNWWMAKKSPLHASSSQSVLPCNCLTSWQWDVATMKTRVARRQMQLLIYLCISYSSDIGMDNLSDIYIYAYIYINYIDYIFIVFIISIIYNI